MKTKKISILLAVLVAAGMTLTTIASAAPEMLILEIQAKGKGYEAVSDDGIVYSEGKHKLDTITLYAHCNRASGEMWIAYYNSVTELWSAAPAQEMVETEDSLLIHIPTLTPIHTDSIGTYYSSGAVSVQFKRQEGAVSSAKMKSLAMSYWQTGQYGIAGSMERIGAVKMKGKKIGWNEVPAAVQALFD